MTEMYHVHPDFSTTESLQCKLAISLHSNAFSFYIYNLHTDSIAAMYYKPIQDSLSIEEYSAQMQLFFTHKDLQNSYSSTEIIYVTPKITIIPAALFKKEDLELIFTFNHTLLSSELVHYYRIKNSESYFVYAIPKEVVRVSNGKFGSKVLWFPQSAPVIESSILQNKLSEESSLFISLDSNFFDAILLEGQKIIMYNTFSFTNVNDYVYFLMNIFEQLQINPLKQKVILSGKISKSSTYFDATKMFVRNVTTMEPFSIQMKLFYPPFNEVSFPLFANLCNLPLCV